MAGLIIWDQASFSLKAAARPAAHFCSASVRNRAPSG
ncbi:MAG: hypothetical protein RIQ75_2214, partial [Pseudomonadota bacterium]